MQSNSSIILPVLIIITSLFFCKALLLFSVRFGKDFLLREKYAKIKKKNFRCELQRCVLDDTCRSHFVFAGTAADRALVVRLAGCGLLDTDPSPKNFANSVIS